MFKKLVCICVSVIIVMTIGLSFIKANQQADEGSFIPEGTKTVIGGGILYDDMFSFTVMNDSIKVSSGVSKADGTIEFEPIKHEAVGRYRYVITEDKPLLEGWSASNKQITIFVEVKDIDGFGTLEAKAYTNITYRQEIEFLADFITFENTYTEPTTTASLTTQPTETTTATLTTQPTETTTASPTTQPTETTTATLTTQPTEMATPTPTIQPTPTSSIVNIPDDDIPLGGGSVKSIKLNKKRVTLKLKGKKKIKLKATVKISGSVSKKVKWKSKKTKIAKVSSSGVVTAKRKGRATVIATSKFDKRKSAKCVIIVKRK